MREALFWGESSALTNWLGGVLFGLIGDFALFGRKVNYRVNIMSRTCELTGKTVQYGNNVSHANNRTRRRFLPNLCSVTLISDAMEHSYRLRVSAQALRSVEHRGGLDAFLLKAEDKSLSPRVRLLKQQILKKQAGKAA